jgi:predicted Zn-dependent peptidase
MVILVVGDVEPEKVFMQVDKAIKATNPIGEIKRIFPNEENKIHKTYVEQKLAVSMPMFQAGFKDDSPNSKGVELLKREVAVKLLLDMIMGRSSDLYNNLYNQGLINGTFDYDYTIEENYAFSMFGGESPDPERVKELISGTISELQKNGLDKNQYDRLIRSMNGRFIKQMNSVERISHSFISVYFKEVNLFDYLEVYDKISFEYVNEVFKSHFNLDKLALSVIKPA